MDQQMARIPLLRNAPMVFPVLCALGLALLVPPTRADELGFLLGHTWTRDELRGRDLREGVLVDRLGTGHCFTITVPYVRTVHGPWSWSTAVTVFHPDYNGRAVSTAEIPLALRWTGRLASLRPYVEAGPAVSWGAGMSTAHEHSVEWSATLDGGAGIMAPLGAERVTLAVHTLNRPQNGQWGRRIALQAGVTRPIVIDGEGSSGAPPPLRRPGSVFGRGEGARRDQGHWDIVPVFGANYRGGEARDHGSGSGVDRREIISATTGTEAGLTTSYGGALALRLSALYYEEHADHVFAENGVTVSSQRAEWTGVIVPLQVQLSPFHGAVRPFVAAGPVVAGGRISEQYVAPPWGGGFPPNPSSRLRFPLGLLFHPTIGADIVLGPVVARAEVRAFTSQIDNKQTTAMYLLGVRVLP